MDEPKALRPLIFDRTLEDVKYAQQQKVKALKGKLNSTEQAEWNAGLRGALNASDLNRMEGWVEWLTLMLKDEGYSIKLQPRRYWDARELIYQQDIDRLRNKITALRDGFFQIPEWRKIWPDNTMTLAQMNAMEWDLQVCWEWLERMVDVFPQAGQSGLFSGQVLYFKGG